MHKARAAVRHLDLDRLCQAYDANTRLIKDAKRRKILRNYKDITTLHDRVRTLVVIARMRDLIIVANYLATINVERWDWDEKLSTKKCFKT